MKASNSSCSAHFSKDSYENWGSLQEQQYGTKKLLIKDAVPSMHDPKPTEKDAKENADSKTCSVESHRDCV